jgi:hypothetical protein
LIGEGGRFHGAHPHGSLRILPRTGQKGIATIEIEVDIEPEKPRRSFPTRIVVNAVIVMVGLFFF